MNQENDQQPHVEPVPILGTVYEPTPVSIGAAPTIPRPKINSDYRTSSTSLDPVLPIDKEDQPDPNSIIKLSKKRWLVLFAMGVFGLCLAVSSDISPILSLILDLLDLREDQYLYLTQIFHYVAAITSIPTAWFVDKHGIKRSILTATTLYVFCALLRVALYSPSLPGWHKYRIFYWFFGGFIGSQVAAIFFMLPLKVAETWFSAKERSIAWCIMISTLEFGVCVVSLIYPRIMQTIPQIKILGYVNIGTLIVTSIVCLTCVSTAAPKHPPSERQARANKEKEIPFKTAMKRIVTSKDVVLHLIHMAIYDGCSMSVSSVFQKILTNAGQSIIFAGNLMSINAFVSIIMLISLSFFVHKADKPILICKLSSAVQSVLHIVYMIVIIDHMPAWILVFMSVVLTVCRCWATPNFTNITADLAAGLVSQATIVGFSIALNVLIMTVINVTFAKLIEFDQKGQDHVSDYTRSLIFISIVIAINEVLYQIFFQGKSAKQEMNESTTNGNHQDTENNSLSAR